MGTHTIRAVLTRDLSPKEISDLRTCIEARSPSISDVRIDSVRSLAMSEADIVISVVIALSANITTDIIGEIGLNDVVVGYLRKINVLKKTKPASVDENKNEARSD